MENRREYSGLIVLLTVLGTLLLGARAQQQQKGSVGNDVTLVPQYTGELKEIIWRINNTLVVEMKLNPLEVFTFKLPRDRFSINGNNGALTIMNLNINDSGSYTAELVLKNNAAHNTEIKLIVDEPSIPNKGVIAACVVILSATLIVAGAFGVAYKRSQKKKKIKLRTAAMSTTAFLDEDTHEMNTAERL